ncbi:MAG: TetR/AcrR family transcriptional regulator [Brevibacterium sp.]|uniref:TetR/AcrR family transcriptional regulator n=1 Tax=Brevibacterium TaxID=1696 RepID=UPI003F8B61A2
MRSTKPDSQPTRSPNSSPETAQRILSAAVREFAEHGFTKTTVRGIAAAAGVSPGLVIHHFGSKEALRTACDDHVFETISESKAQNAGYAVMAVQMMFDDPEMRTALDYLVKSLLDPSEHGQRYFDHYVDLVESYLVEGFAGYTFRRSEDSRGQAATIAVMALAPSILDQRLRSNLGTGDVTATMTRLAPHLLDLYMNGVLETVPDQSGATAEADSPTPHPRSTTDPVGDDGP